MTKMIETTAWAPRDVNAEADDLTNQRFEGFDPSKRRAASLEEVDLIMLPALHTKALEYYEWLQKEKEERGRGEGEAAPKKRRKGERLRDTQPW